MTQSKDTFTFNGFEPANTTPVPDILFDELLSWLTGSELKVLLYIIRRTRGFKKDSDAISLSQFQKGITTKEGKQLDKGCGIDDRQTIINALASLEEKKCIVSEKGKTVKGDNATTVYRILFNQEVVVKSHQGSRENATTLVGNSNHRSGKKPTTVVGNSNPQETVLQETDKQQTDLQERESITVPESDTPTVSPPRVGALALPSKTEEFIEKLREWRIEDEQPEEDITQAETVKVPAVSKQNTSTIPPAQASPPQSEQAALEQTAQQNHSAVTPCSADDIKNRRFQMATPDVPLPETCSVPASTTGVSLANKPALQSQSGVNSRATHGTTNLFSQTPEKPDVPPSGVPPTKGKAKKQAEPKTETPKSPPVEPPSDMAWGTRKCLLWFDYWRGGILIGTYKNSQASTCAKGLAEQFSEEQVIQARTDMEADPYYIGKGGCDVCDVANNIHKYLKRKQQTKNPAQSTNVAQSQPITNIRELVRQREALRAAATIQVGV